LSTKILLKEKEGIEMKNWKTGWIVAGGLLLVFLLILLAPKKQPIQLKPEPVKNVEQIQQKAVKPAPKPATAAPALTSTPVPPAPAPAPVVNNINVYPPPAPIPAPVPTPVPAVINNINIYSPPAPPVPPVPAPSVAPSVFYEWRILADGQPHYVPVVPRVWIPERGIWVPVAPCSPPAK